MIFRCSYFGVNLITQFFFDKPHNTLGCISSSKCVILMRKRKHQIEINEKLWHFKKKKVSSHTQSLCSEAS